MSQPDMYEEWRCPECHEKDGVEVLDMIPAYTRADPVMIEGKWVASVRDQPAEMFWDGAEGSTVICLLCRSQLDMEVDW